MNEALYQKIGKEISSIPLGCVFLPDTTPEDRAKDRERYGAAWKKVCEDNGVTVEEYQIALEAKLRETWGKR